jgi:hypothetical protein
MTQGVKQTDRKLSGSVGLGQFSTQSRRNNLSGSTVNLMTNDTLQRT